MGERHREIAAELIYALDRHNTWEDEYEVALGLHRVRFSRVLIDARSFSMEKFLTYDLEDVSFFKVTAGVPVSVTGLTN